MESIRMGVRKGLVQNQESKNLLKIDGEDSPLLTKETIITIDYVSPFLFELHMNFDLFLVIRSIEHWMRFFVLEI